jgi:hypothetical protein
VALTVHGVGYGLDEAEAFDAEIAGIVDSIESGNSPRDLEEIVVVESNPDRAKRLTAALKELIPNGAIAPAGPDVRNWEPGDERLRVAGYASQAKHHVFVAMPFKGEMEDVFHYGIQSPVKALGMLCERADMSSFTGDVMQWVRNRIQSASLVVADLTDANPNVYLEVGYSWGTGVPTILVVKNTKHLKFDVRGQRCLVYKSIKHLEELLATEIPKVLPAAHH